MLRFGPRRRDVHQGYELRSDVHYEKKRTENRALWSPFIEILVSNLVIAYALIDMSVDFATVQKQP